MEHKVNIVGVALLCVAFGSEALTLGRVRGAALVGQPLDIGVQVQMEAGEDAASLCFEADVFHADTRQEASRVRVVVEATAQPHTANVRVLSSALVDEPVVTVYLRTGCGQKTTRRYVLLADLPSEVAEPSSASHFALASTLPPMQGGLIPAAPVSASLLSVASHAAPAVASPKRPPFEAKSKPGRSPGQPRLKLDSLTLRSDRGATLESSAPVPPPAEALRDMQRMQTLEGDVKALLALAAKNEASLVDLKARLQKAEAARFPSELIYGLIALVLAGLAAVAFFWRRQRRVHAGGDDWWSGATATLASALPEPGPWPGPSPESLAAHTEQDEGLQRMEMSEVNFDDLLPAGAADDANRKRPSSPSPVVAPQSGPARNLNSEAILTIRQQAELFVSLGQTDRAVRILKKLIDESDEPNPFVYLDLLRLFHSLSLAMDFQLLREDFNRLFNGSVPEFAFFQDEGQGLQSYPDVLSRITALWPTPNVLAVLEACIFQTPRDAQRQFFDLAAFRDLLLLHAVAQRVVLVSAPEINGPAEVAMNEMLFPPVLDLDLSDLDTAGPAFHPVSVMDVDIPLLMLDEQEGEAQGVAARPPLDMGNLIDFDLPEAPMQRGSVRQ